jgi:parallel beta-helix repeat protein
MFKNLIFLHKLLIILIIILFIIAEIPPVIAKYLVNDGLKNCSDEEYSLNPIKNRKILYVDDDNTEGPWDGTIDHPFQFIMDAINIVNTGDTIFVFNGVYNEYLKIYKDFQISFDLIGENKEYTHINGRIRLGWYKGSIKIEGFTILDDIILYSQHLQNTLINNNIIYGNIIIADANNIRIENNIIKNGHISLRRSESNTILNNSFTLGGIFFFQSSYAQYWVTHTIENNTINGKQIRHYKSTENILVPEDTGQLILVNCKNFTIKNLVIENVEYGIQLAWSSFNLISNCIIKNASSEEGYQYYPTGILSYYSQKNSFSKCVINNFYYGIYFEGGDFNTIRNTTVTDGCSGIILFSSYNNIVSDNIVKNHSLRGIFLWWAKNNLVTRNLVSSNEYGICLCGEEGSIILKNHISLNSIYGIWINICFSYQNRYCFKIIKNNFIENEENANLEYSKGLWFRNYWDRPRLFPYKINGTTEFFLVWYNIAIDFFGYFFEIFKPPSLKIKRLYDYDLCPATRPYII